MSKVSAFFLIARDMYKDISDPLSDDLSNTISVLFFKV